MPVLRRKVKLAFISNDAARKATFRKRTKGLLKKANELTTLCGVEACMMIYQPDDLQPTVWASSLGVQGVLERFEKMSKMDQHRHTTNQESILKERLSKIEKQLEKEYNETREKELTRLMFWTLAGESLEALSQEGLKEVGKLVGEYKLNIKQRIDSLNKPINGDTPVQVTASPDAPRSEENVQAQRAPVFKMKMEMEMEMEMENLQENMGSSGKKTMLSTSDINFSPNWPNILFL